jgi:hypothetical protein
MLKVVTLYLTRSFHRRTLYIEDKDSTLSQVMQWFGTFRIRTVTHHLSSPLRCNDSSVQVLTYLLVFSATFRRTLSV